MSLPSIPSLNDTACGSSDTDVEKLMRDKIMHTLTVFPFLSASMLNMGIGTSTPTILWKPVLERLIDEGVVTETSYTSKNHYSGRLQSYTIYHLASNPYIIKED